MINYTSISDAWGIKNEKEISKNNKNNIENVDNTKNEKITENNNETVEQMNNTIIKLSQTIENMSSTINKLNNDIETLKNNNLKEEIKPDLIEERQIENFNNSENTFFKDIIEGFQVKLKPHKHIIVYLSILFMILISILLIHSFRKPIEFETAKKNFFVFPEDLDKLKQLIDIAKQ